MEYSLKNRNIIGLIIALFIIFFYYFKLDIILIFIIYSFIVFDLYKSNLLLSKKYLLIFFGSILLSSLFFFYFDNSYIPIFLVFLSSLLLFFFKNLISEFFIFSIVLFSYILAELIIINSNLFYLIILISFCNDSLAYIFGRSIKGPLILPNISPKKTWSGTLISTIISAFLISNLLKFNVYLSFIIAPFLFLGDIYFSYIKRKLSIKDFSNSLSGHGGILDRIDSMYFLILILYFNSL